MVVAARLRGARPGRRCRPGRGRRASSRARARARRRPGRACSVAMPSSVSAMISAGPQRHRHRVVHHDAPAGEHGAEHADLAVQQQRDGDHAGGEHRRGEHAAERQPDLEQVAAVGQHARRARTRSGCAPAPAAKPVISAAEVITQPVPANASSRPKTTRRPSRGRQARSAVARSARPLRSQRAADGVQAGGEHRRDEQEAGERAGQQPEVVARQPEQRAAEGRQRQRRAAGPAAGSA